jgi:uncharacterized protein (DUF2141 family)
MRRSLPDRPAVYTEDKMYKVTVGIISVERFNTPPFRALKKGIKHRIQIPYKNSIPRPFRAALLIALLLFTLSNISAQKNQVEDVTFTVEIHNIIVNRGTIILGFYSSERSFANENPDISFQINQTNNIISCEIVLMEGEYMIGIHQDLNGNSEMDYGLFRIPKEPYAFSNMRGKIPGNFNQSKTRIDNGNNRIIMSLVVF